jgi:hypothetical protein
MNQSEPERARQARTARDELRRGLDHPDQFFAQRGFVLSCHEIEGEWWAALGSRTRYGRGSSEQEAKRSAVRRWMSEEEHPDLRRRPGEPLP